MHGISGIELCIQEGISNFLISWADVMFNRVVLRLDKVACLGPSASHRRHRSHALSNRTARVRKAASRRSVEPRCQRAPASASRPKPLLHLCLGWQNLSLLVSASPCCLFDNRASSRIACSCLRQTAPPSVQSAWLLAGRLSSSLWSIAWLVLDFSHVQIYSGETEPNFSCRQWCRPKPTWFPNFEDRLQQTPNIFAIRTHQSTN